MKPNRIPSGRGGKRAGQGRKPAVKYGNKNHREIHHWIEEKPEAEKVLE